MEPESSSKRILVIAPTPFFADRGCHVRILEEARALRALGYEVFICTYHIGRDMDGIQTFRTLRIPWYSKLSAGPSAHKFYLDLLLLWTVIRAYLKKRPGVIHAHLHEGAIIGKVVNILFRIPLVADFQGSLTGELLQHRFIRPDGLLFRFFRWIESRIVGMPDIILLSTHTALADTDRVGLKAAQMKAAQKTRVIVDGINTDGFSPSKPSDDLRKRFGIPAGAKVVGYLGVLTEYQGLSVLLEAIPCVIKARENIHFLIMGYPNVAAYRTKAVALGIERHVTFTGRVAYDYEEISRYLAICHVGVSPKFSSSEANGKLLNYMAMGLPVVASDTPVNRKILGDFGLYSVVGDPASLARVLLQVLSDEADARSRGMRLRQRAISEYSWQTIGQQIAEVYEDLTRDGPIRTSKERGAEKKWA